MKNTPLPAEEVMYQAFVNKDRAYEGVFLVGVKTTGIFCRPVCTARKPHKKNIEYFSSTQEALDNGYRPCKVCRPMEMYGETPTWLEPLLKEANNSPSSKLRDKDLRSRGIDPARVRRWFKQHHGTTFQSYLRSLRINRAFGQIKAHEKVAYSAFDNGFDSLSGFFDAFKKTTGFSPSQSQDYALVSVTRIPTPLGPMLAGATDDGICLLEFTDGKNLEAHVARLRKLLNAEFTPGTSKHFIALEKQLMAYFKGNLQRFTIPLVLLGSKFQIKVWEKLQDIPFGETRSYQAQAIALGMPDAARAVARANAQNRIAILIPCHRVIGKDGRLAGYGGGFWRKQHLLNLEEKAI